MPVLNPREQVSHDGTADIAAFNRFVQDMTDYIDGYQIPPERQAKATSRFLSGVAREFYAVLVSSAPGQ